MPPKLVVSFFGQKCRLLIKLANDLRTTNVKPKGMLDIFLFVQLQKHHRLHAEFLRIFIGFCAATLIHLASPPPHFTTL
jgi:hypothetical protein